MWCQVLVSLLWFWVGIPSELAAYEEDTQISPGERTKHDRSASRNTEPHTRHTMKKTNMLLREHDFSVSESSDTDLVEELGKEFKWQLVKITSSKGKEQEMSQEGKGVKTEMNPAAWKRKSAWKQLERQQTEKKKP